MTVWDRRIWGSHTFTSNILWAVPLPAATKLRKRLKVTMDREKRKAWGYRNGKKNQRRKELSLRKALNTCKY